MKNTCDIQSDGVCIYVESKLKSSIGGRILLVLINLIAWPIYIYAAAMTPGEELKSFIIPLLLGFVILVFVIGGLSVWIFFGKEILRINTKSLSFSRSFGVIETKEKVVAFSKVSMSFDYVRTERKVRYGKIYCFAYDESDNPFQIYKSSMLIREDDAQNILGKVDGLFANEFLENQKIAPISLN